MAMLARKYVGNFKPLQIPQARAVESHSLSLKMFVEIVCFVLQGELRDLLTDIPHGFTEGDVWAELAFAYAKGNKTSSQMVREVAINISKFNAWFM